MLRAIFGVVVVLWALAGVVFAVVRPPLLSSKVLVVVPASKQIEIQALIAGSDAVLGPVSRSDRVLTLEQLNRQVKVVVSSSTALTITVSAKTAGDAQGVANAVANSYVALVRSRGAPGGTVLAKVAAGATSATGTSRSAWLAELAGLGALAGVVLGVIVVAAIRLSGRAVALQRA